MEKSLQPQVVKLSAPSLTLTNVQIPIKKKETHIGAQSVLAKVTLPGLATVDIRLPITPLLMQEFLHLLKTCSLETKYPTLVNNILYGFPIGPMPTLSNTIIQKNHYKSEEDAALAEKYFHDEVQLVRIFRWWRPYGLHPETSMV
jgi:hypothetical protein